MGRVERMLLNFCVQNWNEEDEVTRYRIAKKSRRTHSSATRKLLEIGVWRCFYKRHHDAMQKASEWSTTAWKFFDQFEAEKAAKSAVDAINEMLEKNNAG